MPRVYWIAGLSACWVSVGCTPAGDGMTDGGASGGSGGAAQFKLGVDIEVADEGRQHLPEGTQVAYKANPPASGPHWPTPAARGFVESALDAEHWVHNLEHGYVVVLFDCRGDCDPQLLEELKNLAATAPASATFGYAKIVVTPYDGLPDGVLLTLAAWEHQMHLSGA